MFERSKYYGNALFKSIKKNSYKKAVQYSNKTQISEEQHAWRPNSDFACKLAYYFVSVLSYSLAKIHQEQN